MQHLAPTPFTPQWQNQQKTLIHTLFEGVWTHHDYAAALCQCRQLLASVQHEVDVIMDMTHGLFLPQGMLLTLLNIFRTLPDNRRLLVYVRAPRLFRMIKSSIAPIVPFAVYNTYFVESLADAHALIANHNTLSDGNVA